MCRRPLIEKVSTNSCISVNSLHLVQFKHLVWYFLLIQYVQGLAIHHSIDITFADEIIDWISVWSEIIPLCRSTRNFVPADIAR